MGAAVGLVAATGWAAGYCHEGVHGIERLTVILSAILSTV